MTQTIRPEYDQTTRSINSLKIKEAEEHIKHTVVMQFIKSRVWQTL